MALQATDLFIAERNGTLYKLPASDLPGGSGNGGGGGGNPTQVQNIDFVYDALADVLYNNATVSIADLSVTAGEPIQCWLGANADYDADELSDFTVVAEAKAGAIEYTISTLGAIVGDFKIFYRRG